MLSSYSLQKHLDIEHEDKQCTNFNRLVQCSVLISIRCARRLIVSRQVRATEPMSAWFANLSTACWNFWWGKTLEMGYGNRNKLTVHHTGICLLPIHKFWQNSSIFIICQEQEKRMRNLQHWTVSCAKRPCSQCFLMWESCTYVLYLSTV